MISEQLSQPKNREFMTECFKTFIQTLPADLIEIMCQNFIQNWINDEDALKEITNDQNNMTGISDQKSIENLHEHLENIDNNTKSKELKSPLMMEKPMMLIEDDHQQLMSDTRNAIINITSPPQKPVEITTNSVNPFVDQMKENNLSDQ